MQKDILEDLRKNAEKRIKSAVGFRHVVDLLASAGKLIVGHNCLLGMLFMLIEVSFLPVWPISSIYFYINRFSAYIQQIFWSSSFIIDGICASCP